MLIIGRFVLKVKFCVILMLICILVKFFGLWLKVKVFNFCSVMFVFFKILFIIGNIFLV